MPPSIVYLHGFASSPASAKARLLAAAVAAVPHPLQPRLHVPMLQFAPREAVAQVAAWVRREIADPASTLTFVGSSLGGYYATHLAEATGARAVLINPAVRPCADLAEHLGTQTNLYTGESFAVLPAHFDDLRAIAVPRITRPQRYLLLVQSGDEVLDWREAVAFYGGAFQYVEGGGDHAFRHFEAQLPALLRFAGVALP